MNQTQALAILKTGANVFLTGEPGSGKTHTINAYVSYLKRSHVSVAVTASTGIAATHIGGITIHSWSGIGIARKLSKYDVDRIATTRHVVRRTQNTHVLIIDEISMLSAETLNSIDRVCRAIHRTDEPFGGMQIIFVGDFFQLPPITDGEDAEFAFQSRAWRDAHPLICYLSEQHRQEDTTFLDILSAVRQQTITPQHRTLLDDRIQRPDEEHIPKLFSHNADVDTMNNKRLLSIPKPSKTYLMAHTGKKRLVEQLTRGCISPDRLTIKEGATVMFTKNHPRGMFVNGTLGTCIGFDTPHAFPIVRTQEGKRITATPMDWTIEDNGRILARISQIPLRLAWAITVHKSQGMSMDAAHIDLRSAFVAGQGYVALSRVRSLKGLYLEGYNEDALRIHDDIHERDREFRSLSEEACDAFDRMSAKEVSRMHSAFIRATKDS